VLHKRAYYQRFTCIYILLREIISDISSLDQTRDGEFASGSFLRRGKFDGWAKELVVNSIAFNAFEYQTLYHRRQQSIRTTNVEVRVGKRRVPDSLSFLRAWS
jgi:hypothetical protein